MGKMHTLDARRQHNESYVDYVAYAYASTISAGFRTLACPFEFPVNALAHIYESIYLCMFSCLTTCTIRCVFRVAVMLLLLLEY